MFLKFKANEPVTLRVLTVDPVVSNEEYRNKDTDEVESVTTKFAFIVYNWTDEKAQILKATPTIARKISELHKDPDFGANIRKVDIKITPTGEMLERRYDIQVLPTAKTLTNDMVKEAQAINLDEKVDGDRMSLVGGPGYEKAKATASALKGEDMVADVNPDEEINLDDIPF